MPDWAEESLADITLSPQTQGSKTYIFFHSIYFLFPVTIYLLTQASILLWWRKFPLSQLCVHCPLHCPPLSLRSQILVSLPNKKVDICQKGEWQVREKQVFIVWVLVMILFFSSLSSFCCLCLLLPPFPCLWSSQWSCLSILLQALSPQCSIFFAVPAPCSGTGNRKM